MNKRRRFKAKFQRRERKILRELQAYVKRCEYMSQLNNALQRLKEMQP